MHDETPVHLLLVEDDDGHAVLIKAVLGRRMPAAAIDVVTDGQQAIDYLSGAPPFDRRDVHPAPDLVLLDLGLPKVSGLEVLEWMASDPDVRATPVVVVTASSDPRDSERALALGARAYVSKPADFSSLADTVRRVLGDARRR